MTTSATTIAKRFQLLFVLPESTKFLVSIYIIVGFLLATIYEFAFGFQMPTSIIAIGVTTIFQAAVLEIIQKITTRKSSIATLRRIAVSLTAVNTVWFVFTLITLSIKGINPIITFSTFILTTLVTLSLTIFIFWPVFVDSFVITFLISTSNIFPLTLKCAVSSITLVKINDYIFPTLLGILFLVAVILSLAHINNVAKKQFHINTFKLFKGFLDSWINFDSTSLEAMLSNFTQDAIALTFLLEFITSDKRKVGLVIPEIHPGPFAPVGSYDLPGKIYWLLKTRGFNESFVLHGAVDHSLNIMTTKDVDAYLSQLTIQPSEMALNNKISFPIKKVVEENAVTGFRFGDSICLFTSVPKGAEDYPSSFRESVKNLCSKIGYRYTILIDAHNAIGDDPSLKTQQNALEGVKQVATELFSAQQFEFHVGFSNKMYTFTSLEDADIGAAGIGCLIIVINGIKHAIVCADSNNSLPDIRPELKKMLSLKSTELIEFCTSDSHFNAARIKNRRGYLVLGESTPTAKIVNDVSSLTDQAIQNASSASLGVHLWASKIRLPVSDILETFGKVLSGALNLTKRTTIFVTLLFIVEYFLFILFA